MSVYPIDLDPFTLRWLADLYEKNLGLYRSGEKWRIDDNMTIEQRAADEAKKLKAIANSVEKRQLKMNREYEPPY